MMRKFSLPLAIFGLFIILFGSVLPVNQYGFEGALDCDCPLRSMIIMGLGFVFTLIGGLIFLMKPFWDLKSNKVFYSVIFLTVVMTAVKIPELYRESQFNEQNCH